MSKYVGAGKKLLQFLTPKPNVPVTKIQKVTRDVKIAGQKLKASTAKLKQTQFEMKNNMPITFKGNKGKSESNREAYKRIQKENTKTIKSMLDQVTEKKANGGRVGRKFGSPKSGEKVPSKLKGFAKLPEKVQEKINKKLAKKV
jgi:acid phosphatase class B